MYKMIGKVLANRLKMGLPFLISETQSAFVRNHLISNNILIAYELTNALWHKRSRMEGFVALKLNMSKAYDRVESSFLEAVMRRMGFRDRWINLIVKCVSSVSYSVLFNDYPSSAFIPQQGV